MTKNHEDEYDSYELEDDEENLYSNERKEEAIDDDEVDELEEGFMKGYEEGEKMAKCALCKKPLGKDFVEEEIGDEIYRFCTEEHADAYNRKKAQDLSE